MHEVWRIERSLWLDGPSAYEAHLADECIMAFGPMGILKRQEIIASLNGAPRWTTVDMTRTTLVTPGDSIAIVIAYQAEAHRDGSTPYRALCTSTYLVLGGVVKLAQHQQTPL